MRDGAQEIPRRVRHVRERGYPVACEQSETRGGEFGGLGCAERDHGVSFTLVGNDDSPLILAENVGSVVTPAGEGDAVAVVFDELRGKVLAEDWEREASKLLPQHVLFQSNRLVMCPRLSAGAVCLSLSCGVSRNRVAYSCL